MGFGFIFYLTFVIIYQCFQQGNLELNFRNVTYFNFMGITTTFPTAIFAYMCHPNVLDVFRELQRSTKTRMSKVLRREMALVMCIYFLVGNFGYITFAANTGDMGQGANILLSAYEGQPTMVTVVQLFPSILFNSHCIGNLTHRLFCHSSNAIEY
jgi:amino acid permease